MSYLMENRFSQLIDQEVNFIELTDMLEHYGCKRITSHLHEDYKKLSHDILQANDGVIIYKGIFHTADSLRKAAAAESGRIASVTVEKFMVVEGQTKVTILFEDANCISFEIATFNLKRIL